MNKKFKIVITFIALCMGLILAGTKVYATTGKTLNDTTRIRKKASTDSDIVEVISDKGEKVEVISEEDEWYKIKYKLGNNTYEGYIRNDLLEVEKTEEKKEDEKKEENTTKQEQKSENEAENKETTVTKIKENDIIQLKNETQIQLLPLIYSCKIGKISANTKVTITEIIGNWCHIESEDKDGWVIKNKISDVSSSSAESKDSTNNKEDEKNQKEDDKKEEDTTKKTETQTKKLYVTTTTLNLREKADTSSRVVTQLDRSDLVILIEKVDSTWSKVKYGGLTGFVASQYLSEEKPSDTTSRGAQEVRQQDNNNQENTNTTNKAEKNKSETNTNTNKSSSTSSTTKKEDNTSKTKTETKTDTTKKTTSDSNKKTESSTAKSVSSKTTESKSSSKVTGSDIVAYAKKFLGYRYVYGTAGPNTFDCSGFTSYVYKHFGYTLDRTSSAQRSNGKAVSKSELQPGDIVCFTGHVGIYIGGNEFIHAANSNKGVIITSLSSSYYVKHYITARRIIY